MVATSKLFRIIFKNIVGCWIQENENTKNSAVSGYNNPTMSSRTFYKAQYWDILLLWHMSDCKLNFLRNTKVIIDAIRTQFTIAVYLSENSQNFCFSFSISVSLLCL